MWSKWIYVLLRQFITDCYNFLPSIMSHWPIGHTNYAQSYKLSVNQLCRWWSRRSTPSFPFPATQRRGKAENAGCCNRQGAAAAADGRERERACCRAELSGEKASGGLSSSLTAPAAPARDPLSPATRKTAWSCQSFQKSFFWDNILLHTLSTCAG